MSGNDQASSIHCVALRVCQLDVNGRTLGQSMYVTQDMIKIDFNPDIESGPEINDRNAAGRLAVTYKIMDVMKRLTTAVETVSPDPVLEALLTGGQTFVSGGTNLMGFQYPPIMVEGNPNGVSIEAWTRAIVNGRQPTDYPWWRWAMPLVKLRKGNRTADVNRMANAYEGYGLENPNWGSGPGGDFTWDSTKVLQAFRDTAIPSATTSVTASPH